MQFDFHKKVMDNVELQKILVNKATAFGATVDVSLLAMNLEANMEYAQSHEWGRQFRVSSQAIRKRHVKRICGGQPCAGATQSTGSQQ